ncbi:DUF4258 domain-containing protein [Candidatus Acetothermia bacterium]|nr:DUF4258 domain-containing protein [Candidatus Acetothermia bacterium]MBI3459671.1 DUF4258 domain-containing protein [Candidatus Acetothermia bacterium]MBI3660027.1 DUF4258 domain-containing protein [Candidatus Acetothermia bacterium]
MSDELLFEVICVLGKRIRITKGYWTKILQDKHPIMEGKEKKVQDTLQNARQVRRSKSDPKVYLYYKKSGRRHVCVVAKHLNSDGFVVTTYLTDNVKEGETVWTRSK